MCSAYSSHLVSKLRENTDLFTVSVVLLLPECSRVGSLQDVAFTDWLLSHSNRHIRSFPVFSWLATSLLFRDDQCSTVWMDGSSFIHPHTEGHHRCSQSFHFNNLVHCCCRKTIIRPVRNQAALREAGELGFILCWQTQTSSHSKFWAPDSGVTGLL